MDYYLPNADQHYLQPSSIHDMIDMDMTSSSDVEMYHSSPHSPSSSKISSSTRILNQDSYSASNNFNYNMSGQMQNKYNTFPPAKLELNGNTGSHLSWLNSLNTMQPHELCNPSMVTNTHSPGEHHHAPVTLSTKTLSLPHNVQIAGGSMSYVSIPSSTQQVYINTMSKPSTHQPSGQQHQGSGYVPVQPQHTVSSNFMLSPNNSTVPTSTVADNPYPKPAYSYSCLIALALKNSKMGSLPVAEIYNFMIRHFPYFKTAPDGWKNSVRHNLSLNKCFEKIENPNADGTNSRKGCLWALNPAKMRKMNEEILKWNKKDPSAIKRAMVHPEILEMLEKGQEAYIKLPAGSNGNKQLSSNRQGGLLLSAQRQRNGLAPITSSPPHHLQHCQPTLQHSPPNASMRTNGMSPLMCNTASSRQQLHAMDVNSAATTHDKFIHETAQLFESHSELALDPALSEINIQNGVWDDLPHDILDIPFSHSPTTFLISPGKDKTSPAISPVASCAALSPRITNGNTAAATLISIAQN